jgi:hypothetical protein
MPRPDLPRLRRQRLLGDAHFRTLRLASCYLSTASFRRPARQGAIAHRRRIAMTFPDPQAPTSSSSACLSPSARVFWAMNTRMIPTTTQKIAK